MESKRILVIPIVLLLAGVLIALPSVKADTVITDTLINTTGNLSARGARYDLGASFHIYDTLDLRSNRIANIGSGQYDFDSNGYLEMLPIEYRDTQIIWNNASGQNSRLQFYEAGSELRLIGKAGWGMTFWTEDDVNADTKRLEIQEGVATVDIDITDADLDLNGNEIKNIGSGNTYFNSSGSLEMGSAINTTGNYLYLGHTGQIREAKEIWGSDTVSDFHIRAPNSGSLSFNYNRDAATSFRSDKADSSTTTRLVLNSGVDQASFTFYDTTANLNTNPIINIGNAGTDFGSNGELTLAGELTCNANATIAAGSVLKLAPTDSPPGCDTEGMIYADDSLNLPCYCNGTTWLQMDDFATMC